MELRHLRYFVKVAELGSFSKAATALFIAQPPLSRQIQALEEEVGTPLLIRSVRGVSLTSAGRSFLVECKALLAHAERARMNAKLAAESEGVSLNLGFISSAAHFIIPNLMQDLRDRKQGVQISAREMLSAEQVQALHAGTIDLGITRWSGAQSTLVEAGVLLDPFCLAVPANHSLATAASVKLEDASNEVFVGYLRDQARAFFDPTQSLCTESGFKPYVGFEVSSTYAVLDLVAAGAGVSLVPSSAVMFADERVVFRSIGDAGRDNCLMAIRRSGETNSLVPLAEEVIGSVFQTIRSAIQLRIV